jgi:hypothetical protein
MINISGCSTTTESNDNVNDVEPVNEVAEPVVAEPVVAEPVVAEPVNSEVEVVQEETTKPITGVPTETTPSSNTLTETNTLAGLCIDSDDGLDYSVKGTVTITNEDDSTKKYTDYCRHGSAEGYVYEYYCANGTVASVDYDCPKGCNNNGACY